MSAYPVLAFFKLYNDYMSQSQRFNTSALSSLLQNIKYNKTVSGQYSTTGAMTYLALNVLFSNLFLNYENDYFTSAWQSPNTPLNAVESINTAIVPASVNSDSLTNGTYDVTLYPKVTSGYAELGQRSLDFLKSFDD